MRPFFACRQTPFPAPAKGQAISALDILSDRIICLAAHGGLTGVTQVSIPGASVNGLPVGLSIVGAHRQDATLVAFAKAMEDKAVKDFTPNIPEVVAEVQQLFERYESALEAKDVAVLDATFWNSPHTMRYALHENGYGFEAIHKHRVARPPGPGINERRIRLEILTIGRDLATVNLEFKVRGHDLVGRQSQTWVRFPEHGWKVIAAHVSTVSERSFW